MQWGNPDSPPNIVFDDQEPLRVLVEGVLRTGLMPATNNSVSVMLQDGPEGHNRLGLPAPFWTSRNF
jgi:hypothetical protein